MTTALKKPETTTVVPASLQPIVQKESGRRGMGSHGLPSGKSFVDVALSFAAAFKIGDHLKPEEFDAWAFAHGWLTPPADTNRQSIHWKAHLQNRHELKKNLHKASTTSRMVDLGSFSFALMVVNQNLWEVRSPHEAIFKNTTAQRLDSLMQRKRKDMGYLIQSVAWNSLTKEERFLIDELWSAMDDWEEDIHKGVTRYERKLDRVEKMLQLHPLSADHLLNE